MWRWQRGYAEAGVEDLLCDKTRPPGTPPHSTEMVAEVLALTCSEPPGEVTHWTGRAVSRAVEISLRAVQRIRDAHRLQPHRLRTVKRSRDLAFAAKVEDVVGLYMEGLSGISCVGAAIVNPKEVSNGRTQSTSRS